jgi:hypothetical protein
MKHILKKALLFVSRCLPDAAYLKLMYRRQVGRKLSLQDPRSFNEKLQWLKLYDRNPAYIEWVDKYAVRQYIADRIGKEYLIPLIGVWDSPEEIDFDALPGRFVLKCTHDSGGVVICEDKKTFDAKGAREKLRRYMRKNYFWIGREWPYKNIRPRIICEQYMSGEAGGELKDYKFLSFNGEVKCLFVCLNRDSKEGLNVDFYDLDWNAMPFERHYKRSGQALLKPRNFDKMIALAQTLSKNIPFIRVDFYEADGKIYFGELTLYPGNGFEEFTPESYDDLLGSWIHLPLQ